MKRLQLWALNAALALAAALPAGNALAASTAPQTGVFYFPGWRDHELGLGHDLPWEPIKAYPERKPVLGWYHEGDETPMAQHLAWMQQYGIGFVVFDAYWLGEEHQRPLMAQATEAYLRAKDKRGVKFALMYANHDGRPRQGQDFYALIAYWLDHYLTQPDYLKLDGRPVVFIMGGEDIDVKARKFGSSAKLLFDRAQAMARAAGLPGLYFVGGTGANDPLTHSAGSQMGYSAYFAYNYHAAPGQPQHSHSYAELDQGYRAHWRWFIDHSDLPYVIPTTSGWDSRPWGGSADPAHDRSVSTPAQFKQHLAAARALMQANPKRTPLSVICCWNEFGEGSYIEPTQGTGMSYLEAVQAVFDSPTR
jgi:hypothetical protein